MITGVAFSAPNAATGAVTGKASASDCPTTANAATSAAGTVSVSPNNCSTSGAVLGFTPTTTARQRRRPGRRRHLGNHATVTVAVRDPKGAIANQVCDGNDQPEKCRAYSDRH